MKRASKFNPELAASVLVEALLLGDQKAVARYGITDRTLRNWRRCLASDPSFSAIFRMKKEAFDAAWVDQLAAPIQRAMSFISEACSEMDPRQRSNPEMIHAVAGALKICAEIYITDRALDVSSVVKSVLRWQAPRHNNEKINVIQWLFPKSPCAHHDSPCQSAHSRPPRPLPLLSAA